MAIELKIEVKDDGSKTIKKFTDDTKKSIQDVTKATGDMGKQTSSTVGGMINNFKNIKTEYLAFAGAVGVGVAAVNKVVGEIREAIIESINYQHEIEEISYALGFNTKTTQALDYVMKASGKTVESATRGFSIFYGNISEAYKGEGDAVEIFKRLNIEIKDQFGYMRDGEGVVMDAIQALHNETNETQRAIDAKKLFGRAWFNLIPVIEQGTDGLEKVTEKLEKMGVHVDPKKVEDYMKAVNDLNTAFLGLKMGIVEGLVNPLSKGMTKLSELVSWINSNKEIIGKAFQYGTYPGLIYTGVKELYGKPGETKIAKPFETSPAAILSRIKEPLRRGLPVELPEMADPAELVKTEEEARKKLGDLWDAEQKSKLDGLKAQADIRLKNFTEEQRQLEDIQKYKDKKRDVWNEEQKNDWMAEREQMNQRLEGATRVADALASGIGQSMADIFVLGQSVNEVFDQLGKTIMIRVVGALTEAIAKALILKSLGSIFGIATGGIGSLFTKFLGFEHGGMVPEYQTGGIVGRNYFSPKLPNNEVLIRATPGEGILTRETTKNLGGGQAIDRMNKSRGYGMDRNQINIVVNAEKFDEDFCRSKLMPTMDRLSARSRR